MQPTPISQIRIEVIGSHLPHSRVDSDGAVTSEGLNDLIEGALSEWAEVGYTELVDIQYSATSDAEYSGRHLFSALLVVRKPADD